MQRGSEHFEISCADRRRQGCDRSWIARRRQVDGRGKARGEPAREAGREDRPEDRYADRPSGRTQQRRARGGDAQLRVIDRVLDGEHQDLHHQAPDLQGQTMGKLATSGDAAAEYRCSLVIFAVSPVAPQNTHAVKPMSRQATSARPGLT